LLISDCGLKNHGLIFAIVDSIVNGQRSLINNQQSAMKVCGGAYVSSMYGQCGVNGRERVDGRDCGARREHGAWNEESAERKSEEGNGKEKRRWQQ
jgi:hypothetical protein